MQDVMAIPANPRDGLFHAKLSAHLMPRHLNKLSVGGWQGKCYAGEEADILWNQHMTTQKPLESFKSFGKN